MIERPALSGPSVVVSIGEVTAQTASIGSGVPSRKEMAMCLVSRRVSDDWNIYLSHVSFDFRTVKSKKRVYLRKLPF